MRGEFSQGLFAGGTIQPNSMIRPVFSAVLGIATVLLPIGSGIWAGRIGADRDARISVQITSLRVAPPWLKAARHRRGMGRARLRTAGMPSSADLAAVLQSEPGSGGAGPRLVPRANGESGPAQSVPPCQTYSADTSQMAVVSSLDMPGLTYVDEPLEQLEETVPHLNPTQLDATHDASASGAAVPPQHEREFILDKTSAAVADMVRRMPNLIATETVRKPVEISGSKAYNTLTFNYAIVHNQEATSDLPFVEFRTDARGQRIDYSPDNPGRPVDVGFATMWLIFMPGKLHESRFRYLGEQSIDHRKTYVLAFAQNPEKTGLRVVINYPSGECSTPVQGIAWIDQLTFQIDRVQTDLLSPLPLIQLYQLRSILTYSAVEIAGLKVSLWLPREVDTRWQEGSWAGAEFHRYSHYRLFKAKVKILPGFKRLRK